MSNFSNAPEPPYFAVIFTSTLGEDIAGYDVMGRALIDLAERQPGFIGIETTRAPGGLGITVSYWEDEDSILTWKNQTRHLLAQKTGIEKWYSHYELRVARVERAYSGPHGRQVE